MGIRWADPRQEWTTILPSNKNPPNRGKMLKGAVGFFVCLPIAVELFVHQGFLASCADLEAGEIILATWPLDFHAPKR